MANQKFKRTKAWVLRRTNYGEADRILNLITPEGQISAVARGVRKSKSKLAGAIELFCLSDVVLVGGKNSGMATLSSASLIEQFSDIVKDYERLMFAYEVLRQVERASRDVSNEIWFEIVGQVLPALNQMNVSLNLIKVWFYLRLSDHLGEEFNLLSDEFGNEIQAETNYRYDWESKNLSPDVRGEITTVHIKLMRLVMSSPLRLCAKVSQVDAYAQEILLVCQAHAGLN